MFCEKFYGCQDKLTDSLGVLKYQNSVRYAEKKKHQVVEPL